MMKRDARGPLIFAVALLVLPLLYVASFLSLVRPYLTQVAPAGSLWIPTTSHEAAALLDGALLRPTFASALAVV